MLPVDCNSNCYGRPTATATCRTHKTTGSSSIHRSKGVRRPLQPCNRGIHTYLVVWTTEWCKMWAI